MLQTQWTDVERVLDRVLDHPTSEWDAVVEAECGSDPELRRAVESLLRQASNLDGFLEGPAARVTALLREVREEPDRTGERLGAWQLGDEIGRGGMGVVYRAERADGQYAQTAAVKLVRTGGEAAEAMRRFTLERQLLATLDHPGVARLLDGGVTPGGQPFLVMEYVDGEALDAYCDRRRLTVEARLALFLDVCEAVAHAHRHLVVHRDLKPSNIAAIEGEDGRPRVKLLDFGIAKLLEGSGDGAVLTQAAQRAFTPEYAAPEQVEGRAVTTATDVYGLGVVLFELIAGQRPFHADPAAHRALERAILETSPPHPSSVVTEAAASARATTATRLRGQLSGDLDAIVAKALRKEPESRYATADALAADLRLHLSGLPVEARRGARGYRLRTFIQRNRAAVAAAAAVFVLLVGATAVFATQAARLRLALVQAKQEEQKAQATSNFLQGVMRESQMLTDNGRPDARAREVMARALAKADSGLSLNQPAAYGDLLGTIATAMMANGQRPADALPLADRALAVARQTYGPGHVQEANALAVRARVAMGLRGKEREADSLYTLALRMMRAIPDPDTARYGEALIYLAFMKTRQNRSLEAIPLLEEARRIIPTYNTPQRLEALEDLGIALEFTGRNERAVAVFREGLALSVRAYGPDEPNTSALKSRLARALQNTGRYEEALRLNRESYEGRRLLPGGADNRQLLPYFYNVGGLLMLLGRHEEAEPLLRQGVSEARRLNRGRNIIDLALALTTYGRLLTHNGQLDEAAAAFAEADSLFEQGPRIVYVTGKASTDYAQPPEGFGEIALRRGDLAEAERQFRRALALSGDPGDLQRATVEVGLGRTLTAAGRHDEAEPLLRSSLTVLRAARHPGATLARQSLVALYDTTGRPALARRYRTTAGSPVRQ